MTDFRFRSEDGEIDVNYKTDILQNNPDGRFTIMQIDGLDPEEVEMGFPSKELESNVGEFIKFAEDNDLELTRNDGKSVQTLVELPEEDPQ